MWMIGYTVASSITGIKIINIKGYCLVGCGILSIFILTFTVSIFPYYIEMISLKMINFILFIIILIF